MRKEKWPAIFAGLGLMMLILDTKTALSGAAEGIEICAQVLIPSLFPFLFLSAAFTTSIAGHRMKLLRPLGRMLRIPEGAESIVLLGFLGGYPVGAQSVAQAVKSGNISRGTGKRMLAFCSNAGPSFIFGIGCRLFPDIRLCWLLWGIHICAALLVGILVPGNDSAVASVHREPAVKPSALLRRSLWTMGMICGWVVLFRVLLGFCERWFLWLLPQWAQSVFIGILELANGCYGLSQIEDITQRFVICSAILCFGGLCVMLQTYSVCDSVDCRWYLPGKLLQSIFGILLSGAVISREMRIPCLSAVAVIFGLLYILRQRIAKKDSNPQECMV